MGKCKFLKHLLFFYSIIFVVNIVPAKSYADANICVELQEFEQTFSKKLPTKIDSATELISVRVNCEAKSVTYVKRILVDQSGLNSGWEKRKQRQHTQLHCNKHGLASLSNWSAIDNIHNVDYQYILTLFTRPSDCINN